jgi:ribosome biogenesis GTPase / thiamine phosphate phosphatase
LDPALLDQIIREADHLRKRSNRPTGDFDCWVERALKKRTRAAQSVEIDHPGVVASVLGSEILVESQGELVRVAGCLMPLVVGDEVRVGTSPQGPVITESLPRRTKLSRPDVGGKALEKVIAANMDMVMIVVSFVSPPFHPRLIDRFLVAIEAGGAQPGLCINKLDLLGDSPMPPEIEIYKAIGLTPILCSTSTGVGLETLREKLAGKTAAFVGHSGVGKSSLVNALFPELDLRTGEVIKGYGRGAHTTTWSSLHHLPLGTTLIDTPGIKSLGLWSLTLPLLLESFPELSGVSCRFRDCRHQNEPGCGVKQAVEKGDIAPYRYDAFLRLLGEVQEG